MDLELQRELQGGSGALGVVDPWGLSLELDCVTPVGLALRVPKMLINVNKLSTFLKEVSRPTI